MRQYLHDKISKLEAEIESLKTTLFMQSETIEKLSKQLEDAKEYAARTLVEHNVSGAFVRNYVEKYGDVDEWVNTAYLKELFEILKLEQNQRLSRVNSTVEREQK